MATLKEIARRIDLVRWDSWRDAVGVRDGGFHPPESWADEIDAAVRAYIEIEMAERLRRFDTDDLYIAALHAGMRMAAYSFSNADLDAWKRATPDWSERLARWRERRDEYAKDSHALLCEIAPAIVTRRIAEAKAVALGNEIDKDVKSAITAPSVAVRGAPNENPAARRDVDREEVLVAVLDIMNGTMTIGSVVFSMVQVELPAEMKVDEAIGAGSGTDQAKEPLSDHEIAELAIATQKDLKEKSKPHGRNEIVKLLAKNLGEKQAHVRRAWDSRPGAVRRKHM